MGFGAGGFGALPWGAALVAPAVGPGTVFPVTLLGAASGPLTGGTHLTLVSSAMDASSAEPTWDGTLDGWSTLYSGGGTATELTAGRAIVLHAGSAGAVAGLRRTSSDLNLDVSLVGTVTRRGLVQASVPLDVTLVADAGSSGTDFRVRWLASGEISVRSRLNGAVLFDVPTGLVARDTLALRLLRLDGTVRVFVGRQLVGGRALTWTSGSAQIEVAARDRAVTRLSGYARRPVVTFGGEPATSIVGYVAGAGRGTVITPAYTRPDVVDVAVYGPGGVGGTVTDGFEYVSDGRLLVSAGGNLELLSDATLRRRRT